MAQRGWGRLHGVAIVLGLIAPTGLLALQSPASMRVASQTTDLRAKAVSGDPSAQFALAQLLDRTPLGFRGIPTPEQQEQARRHFAEVKSWYRRAAEQGHSAAQYELARRLQHPPLLLRPSDTNPDGALAPYEPSDEAQALRWFRAAAEQGHAEAQYSLGLALGDTNNTESLAWIRKAAEAGHRDAQETLAGAYEEGDGLPRDLQLAFAWHSKAASQGSPTSAERLGLFLYRGIGTTANVGRAVPWLQTAADAGRPLSQTLIAALYETGNGLPQNFAEAHKWFNIAATLTSRLSSRTISVESPEEIQRIAVAGRDRVARRLAPVQLSEAQALATDWIARFDSQPRRR